MRRHAAILALLLALAGLPLPAWSAAPSYVDSTEAATSSATSLAIPAPSGILDDDCMVAAVISADSRTISPPAGWTEQFHSDLPSTASTPTMGVWTRTASSESGSYTFSIGSSSTMIGFVSVYRDCSSDPDVKSSFNTGTSSSPSSPSVTTTVDDTRVIRIVGIDDAEAPTTEANFCPAGLSCREVDEQTGTGNGATLGLADATLATAGSTGAVTWNPDASEEWGAVTLALAPPTDHFEISHDSSADACTAENVTITKHDAAHATDTGYTGTITLSTSTSTGDWSLVTGAGTLVNSGDGDGTYTYDSGDNGVVVLGLRNGTGGTVDIDVTDGSASEIGSEDPSLTVTGGGGTYLDQFNAVAYTGDDGTLSWTNNWQELGESDGASSGRVTVNTSSTYCASPNCLRIGGSENSISGRGVSREADLSTAGSATLTFSRRRNVSESGGSVSIDVSGNGGSSWTTLATYSLNGSDGSQVPESFDITSYIASNTQIRFIGSGTTGEDGGYIYVDDVQIETVNVCPHFAISHDGAAESCDAESVTITKHDDAHATETSYAGTITLSTSTGNGRWSLVTGAGTLVNSGDGDGTYAYDASDSGVVVLGIKNSNQETLNIDVTDGSEFEDSSEDPDLTFNTVTDTFRDEFNSTAYTGSDGTASWATNWLEINESDGAALGDEVVVTDLSDTRLRVRDNDSGGEGVQREADLSAYTAATLTFLYRRSGLDGSTDYVAVEASGNGGSSWTELARFQGATNDGTYQSASYDITTYIASNTRIRFISSANLGSADQVYFDDVQIEASSTIVCPAADHFVLSHDGAGINCLGETITVTVEDSSDDTVTDYGEEITLDTQTGKGTWTNGGGNSGTFLDATANDGLATYTFDTADNGVASFTLTYVEGTASFDLDAFQTSDSGIRDDDTEGSITFSPSGFTVTASALSNPPPNPINDPIPTQTAGTSFAVHLTAYGQTPTDTDCGVIEAYTGSKSIKFWSTYSNPSSGTVQATVDASAIATTEGASSAQSVTFTSGQASVTAKYKDVGEIQVSMKDDTVSEPAGGVTGATNLFVVKPDDFVVTSIADPNANPNPGTSIPTGTVFVTAGGAFTVDVEVRDSEGDRTPNYGNESSAEGIVIVASTLVAPAGGRNGSANDGAILNGTSFSATSPAGTFTGSSFGWDEVGAIKLQASVADADYLGVGDVTGTESGTVGRFTPADFAVSLNAPSFETTCAAGGFSYLGQPFDFQAGSEPVITVTSRAAAATTTQNYTGSWWRLTNASLANRSYTAASGTLDTSGLPATGSDPAIVDSGDGTGTLTFSSGTGLLFTRTGLVAPFDADLSLAIDVIDLDSIAYASNPARFAQATAGNGVDFSAGKEMRFGRVAIANAHGSELVALDLPLQAEHYDGVSFVLNSDDVCTSVDTGDLTLTKSPGSLPSTSSIGQDPMLAGDADHALSAPGDGNDGTVDVEADLSGASVPWLRYDWPHDGNLDGTYDDNPIGRGTFGIFAGDDPVIYLREIY